MAYYSIVMVTHSILKTAEMCVCVLIDIDRQTVSTQNIAKNVFWNKFEVNRNLIESRSSDFNLLIRFSLQKYRQEKRKCFSLKRQEEKKVFQSVGLFLKFEVHHFEKKKKSKFEVHRFEKKTSERLLPGKNILF